MVIKRYKIYFIIMFLNAMLIFACGRFNNRPKINGIDLNIKINRFDKDLFSIPFDSIENNLDFLRDKYPDFFELYNEYILNIGNSHSPVYKDLLLEFLTHYSVQIAFKEVENKYNDIGWFEDDLTESFKYFKYYFPGYKVPQIVTFIGGFQQSIVIDDSLLAIGLDNYLGRDNELYKRLGTQQYLKRNMYKNKIVPDCMLYWLKTEFMYNDSIDNVINQMIYQGKLLYATKQLLPDTPDSLIVGFTSKQMEFCEQNEKKMWTFLVEYKKLFSTDKMDIKKLIEEGPFTHDFTNESPARAVTWIGWKIVENYMKRNKVTLFDLMLNDNYISIYNNARYAP